MSPYYGMQLYRHGPSSRLRRYSDFRLVVLFLWKQPRSYSAT